jgi:hypothetical protein
VAVELEAEDVERCIRALTYYLQSDGTNRNDADAKAMHRLADDHGDAAMMCQPHRSPPHVHRCPECYDHEVCALDCVIEPDLTLDNGIPCGAFLVCSKCQRDRSSCGEECPPGECSNSLRHCRHHCNCSWSQEKCCWCGEEFGEVVP